MKARSRQTKERCHDSRQSVITFSKQAVPSAGWSTPAGAKPTDASLTCCANSPFDTGAPGWGTTGFPWLLTQTNIADAAGLSIVHVNRMIQGFRLKGLIGPQDKTMHILNWPGLVEEGEFDPAYLHLN